MKEILKNLLTAHERFCKTENAKEIIKLTDFILKNFFEESVKMKISSDISMIKDLTLEASTTSLKNDDNVTQSLEQHSGKIANGIKIPIRQYRKKQNLSQRELAQKLLVSQQTIAKWENEKCYPSTEKLVIIAEALGCTINDLFDKKELDYDQRKIN